MDRSVSTYQRTAPTYTEELSARYIELQELKKKLDGEIVSVERGLRVAGLLVVRGKPRLAPTHTIAEARDAHRRWQKGERDDEWVAAGERQYQRENKAARIAAKRAAA